MSEALEKAAEAIKRLLNHANRPDTPYGSRRAIDKSCYEVYFLDYPEWQSVIAEATVLARFHDSAGADAYALTLQTRYLARAAITAFLSEVEPEALARTWKPFAFNEADSYYPYRGQIRKSAIYDASEMLAALRKLMNPDKTSQQEE